MYLYLYIYICIATPIIISRCMVYIMDAFNSHGAAGMVSAEGEATFPEVSAASAD